MDYTMGLINVLSCFEQGRSHLYGITVNHHKYDAAGVCLTANTKVQEVLLQTGRQDQWLENKQHIRDGHVHCKHCDYIFGDLNPTSLDPVY